MIFMYYHVIESPCERSPPLKMFNNNRSSLLNSTLSSARRHSALYTSIRSRTSNILPFKIHQESSISFIKCSRAAESIDHTSASQVCAAHSVCGRVGRGEELAVHGRFNDGVDVLEHVTLGEDHATGTNFEGVAGGVVPVVVDLKLFSMHNQVTAWYGGRTA